MNSILSGEGRELFLAYRRFKMYGVMPGRGGLYEQAAIFLNTLEFCDGAMAFLDRKKDEWQAYVKSLADKDKQADGF
jgi:hypothetical protein